MSNTDSRISLKKPPIRVSHEKHLDGHDAHYEWKAKAKFRKVYEKKKSELNDRLLRENKVLMTDELIAQIVLINREVSYKSRKEIWSKILNGKLELRVFELRMLRKLFNCTMEEFYPCSHDIANLPLVKFEKKNSI